MIRRLLVPNRGEIAVRIARGCREMGITAVLGHEEADRDPFVRRSFDDFVSLGSGRATDTYLNVARVIDAARAVGVDAIHPGYGFLSERAELAEAAADAGIIFVGPSADVIERMGSKAGSRKIMAGLGVPVIPGYDGEDQAAVTLKTEAEGISYPVIVKASAGGGGKGMKVVRSAHDFPAAIESARREAAAAFGNDRLVLEKFLEKPRHVEFQVFGDSYGNVLHLFERDCSVQRRHQKVVEETPAPRFSEEMRRAMAASAVAAAEGIGYENAGTVEFIVDGDEYYFLEMNTRLQVEHPITEMVVDVDLVRAQIEVASGAALPWIQGGLHQQGHAIECRIYAEDPDNGFLPQGGAIQRYREPSGPGVRVDSGIERGSKVHVSFDPLLAKLVAWGESREHAVARMRRALREFVILGATTNLSHLLRVMEHRAFVAGHYSTALLEEMGEEPSRPNPDEAVSLAAILDSARRDRKSRLSSGGQPGIESIWEGIGGLWR